MAKFKVGDRVRVIACNPGCRGEPAVGAEGVIFCCNPDEGGYIWEFGVDIPSCPNENGIQWGFNSEHLEPILPERDEAFDRFFRKITETAPLVELVRETEKALLSGIAK